ncbi:MAG: CPBP family intramembrane metalloprotease [Lachnospiraceae bacterium]|nr:CPBP family intramembrane metalloprotease [Lachnospiraceae bacterium]
MKKEYTFKSKILRKIIIGMAVYAGSYLLTLLVLIPFISFFKYGNSSLSLIAMFVAGLGSFLTITSDEKTTLLYDPDAVFAKKPYFFLFVIFTSFSFTIVFNYLFDLIPWEIFGDKFIKQDNDTLFAIPLYMRIIGYVFIAPFSEEVLFRGVIFFRFKKLLPLWASVLAAALFFGLYHGNLMQGLYAFIMGSVMCLVFHYGGSFLYPFLFHAIANLISNLCFEFEAVEKALYSPLSIILSAAYLVVAIILSYVFKVKLTKKDKKC